MIYSGINYCANVKYYCLLITGAIFIKKSKGGDTYMSKVKETNLNLAQSLLKLRQQNNLTQDEFAQKIGVTRQAVSRWEMGISAPSSKTLIRISEEFDIPFERIIGSNFAPQTKGEEKAAEGAVLVKWSILLMCIGLIGLISLPFLAEMKQAKEMEVFQSAYEHAYHYITEFPLSIILIFSVVLLIIGGYSWAKLKAGNNCSE